jgi:hypothetical protein
MKGESLSCSSSGAGRDVFAVLELVLLLDAAGDVEEAVVVEVSRDRPCGSRDRR